MKVGKHTQTLDAILDKNAGFITTAEALQAGVPKDAFYYYVADLGLEKQSHGIYLAQDAFPDEFALLQARFPKAIFSHDSALFLHGMSEREPIPLSVSVESSYNSSALKEQGARIHYIKPEWHTLGVCEVSTPEGNIVKAYDKERAICDLVREKTKTDVTEFNYAVKAFACSKDKNLARLSDYARAMNIETRVWNTIGVIL